MICAGQEGGSQISTGARTERGRWYSGHRGGSQGGDGVPTEKCGHATTHHGARATSVQVWCELWYIVRNAVLQPSSKPYGWVGMVYQLINAVTPQLIMEREHV